MMRNSFERESSSECAVFATPGENLPKELPRQDLKYLAAALWRERIRIARELHDQVVQELILTIMSLRRLASPRGPQLDETLLLQATAAVSRGLSNTRKLLGDLRARECQLDAFEPQVCLADVVLPIMALAEPTAQVEVQIASMKDIVLGGRVATEVGMIVREAVLNATRHSGARAIACRAKIQEGCVNVEVADNGCGFEPSQGVCGFGLMGMMERASVLGATLEIRSRAKCGTVVRLQLPQAPNVLL